MHMIGFGDDLPNSRWSRRVFDQNEVIGEVGAKAGVSDFHNGDRTGDFDGDEFGMERRSCGLRLLRF